MDDFVGPGYGVVTSGVSHAVQLAAQLEGLLLDPVYTGKAMSGLTDLGKRGMFCGGENVVFLHTGGSPGLFGYVSFFAPFTSREKVKARGDNHPC
jgi:L-cysteate sulfo-lyase